MPHCDCPAWAQTLLPCKHFVAVMSEFKEWTWDKFPEEYKSSPYFTLDRPVSFNSSEMGEDEPNTLDESQSANHISHFFDLPEAKSTFRSKAASCRELLKEIKSLTYTTYDEETMSDLYDTLDKAYSKLKLDTVDDNGLLLENSTDIQVIRKEKLRATTSENSSKSIKTLNIPLRKRKRSAYTVRIGAHAEVKKISWQSVMHVKNGITRDASKFPTMCSRSRIQSIFVQPVQGLEKQDFDKFMISKPLSIYQSSDCSK